MTADRARGGNGQRAGAELETLSRPRNQSDQALEVLTDAIVSGQLVAGTLYSVQGLSEQLGVSRTPVREALIQLARQGMVQFERNRGVRVVPISVRELGEIFQMRLWLEVPATILGTERMTAADRKALRRTYRAMEADAKNDDLRSLWRHDRLFHEHILRAAGNARVVEYLRVLRDLLVIRRTTTVERSSRTPQQVVNAHRPILEAIESGDAQAAGAAMGKHLEYTGQLLQSQGRDELVHPGV